jgi:putative salt-induced outer membrane protein YdiY
VNRFLLVFGLSLAVCVGSVFGDELIFKNGDRLKGKIVQLVEGKLVFESEVAGKLTVEMAKVSTFSSDSPVKVHLKDGTVLHQKLSAAEANRFAVQESQMLKAQEFEMAAISALNPPDKPKPRWSGDISAGLSSTHGNTKTDSISGSASLKRRTEKDRTTLSADYVRRRQEDPDTGQKNTTEDWWRTKGKYDYFFTKRLYGYLDGRYEKDSIAELDRRVIIGGGGGYQWVESEDMNFSTEAGLASLYEKFDNQTESNSELSAQLGYYFDKKLTKAVKFIHDLTYYPSTGNLSDYFLTSTAEFRANFTEKMFANFKVILDYDATPAEGSGKTDTKYIVGVGWSF